MKKQFLLCTAIFSLCFVFNHAWGMSEKKSFTERIANEVLQPLFTQFFQPIMFVSVDFSQAVSNFIKTHPDSVDQLILKFAENGPDNMPKKEALEKIFPLFVDALTQNILHTNLFDTDQQTVHAAVAQKINPQIFAPAMVTTVIPKEFFEEQDDQSAPVPQHGIAQMPIYNQVQQIVANLKTRPGVEIDHKETLTQFLIESSLNNALNAFIELILSNLASVTHAYLINSYTATYETMLLQNLSADFETVAVRNQRCDLSDHTSDHTADLRFPFILTATDREYGRKLGPVALTPGTNLESLCATSVNALFYPYNRLSRALLAAFVHHPIAEPDELISRQCLIQFLQAHPDDQLMHSIAEDIDNLVYLQTLCTYYKNKKKLPAPLQYYVPNINTSSEDLTTNTKEPGFLGIALSMAPTCLLKTGLSQITAYYQNRQKNLPREIRHAQQDLEKAQQDQQKIKDQNKALNVLQEEDFCVGLSEQPVLKERYADLQQQRKKLDQARENFYSKPSALLQQKETERRLEALLQQKETERRLTAPIILKLLELKSKCTAISGRTLAPIIANMSDVLVPTFFSTLSSVCKLDIKEKSIFRSPYTLAIYCFFRNNSYFKKLSAFSIGSAFGIAYATLKFSPTKRGFIARLGSASASVIAQTGKMLVSDFVNIGRLLSPASAICSSGSLTKKVCLSLVRGTCKIIAIGALSFYLKHKLCSQPSTYHPDIKEPLESFARIINTLKEIHTQAKSVAHVNTSSWFSRLTRLIEIIDNDVKLQTIRAHAHQENSWVPALERSTYAHALYQLCSDDFFAVFLKEMIITLCETDMYYTVAQAAQKYHLAPVTFSNDFDSPPIINISGGWNPHASLIAKGQTKNDITLGSTGPDQTHADDLKGAAYEDPSPCKHMLITAPNSSGKSIFLTMILNNVVLAQVFGFACADACTLTPLENIEVAIKVDEKTGLGLSTGAAQTASLKGITANIRRSFKRTLLIADEPLSGTTRDLAKGIFEDFITALKESHNVLSCIVTHFDPEVISGPHLRPYFLEVLGPCDEGHNSPVRQDDGAIKPRENEADTPPQLEYENATPTHVSDNLFRLTYKLCRGEHPWWHNRSRQSAYIRKLFCTWYLQRYNRPCSANDECTSAEAGPAPSEL